MLIVVIAAAALSIWAHAEVEMIKRRGYRECVHANFTIQPQSASALDAEHKLAMCEH